MRLHARAQDRLATQLAALEAAAGGPSGNPAELPQRARRAADTVAARLALDDDAAP